MNTLPGGAAASAFRAVADGSKVRLYAPYSDSLQEFFNSLPSCKWDKKNLCWVANLTPAVAWRLMYGEVRFQADDRLMILASGIQASSLDTSQGMIPQPSLRNGDLWRHQLEAYRFGKDLHAVLYHLGMGCVSADTEFLSPSGWKRIDDWDGDSVAQFDPVTHRAEFVDSPEFVKLPCDEMWHFKHSRGMDQILCDEHRFLWYDYRDRPRFSAAADMAKRAAGTSHAKYLAAFELENKTRIDATEDQIRLMVAVMADGSFNKHNAGNTCAVRLKKKRKVERLRELLRKSETPYSFRYEEKSGYFCFRFKAPWREKTYGPKWWAASLDQRKAIADECPHWDGSHRKAGAVSFFSRSEESATFIQYCFASTGRRASIRSNVRKDGKTDYVVLAVGDGRSGNFISLALKNGNVKRVPSPDGHRYCFRVPSGAIVLRRNGRIFTTGNCGKSMLTISLAANKRARTVLICCPKSVLGVWKREFSKHCPVPHEVLSLGYWGASEHKAKEIRKFMARRDHSKISVVLVNYELIWREHVKKALCEIHWNCVVADESQRIKTHNSNATKAIVKIAEKADFRVALSGTPMQIGPMDLFGQFLFLDPGVFGTSFHRFRTRYAKSGHFGAGHIVGYQNQDELASRMKLLTFHADRSVLDLPEVQHITIPVTLGTDTRKLYDQLQEEMLAQVAEGVVSVQNALTKTLRLRQICGGFVQTDDGELAVAGSEKKDALVDLLEGMDAPCVVFCEFRHDLEQIAAAAKEAGRTYGELSGQRKDLTEHAQMPEGIDVMGVQVRSGGVGVDLTRAPFAVYWNHPWSPGIYDQSVARVHRPGQDKPVTYYHLNAENTIDETVWRALEKKQDAIQAVMSYLKNEG